jgi:hypothetical protein
MAAFKRGALVAVILLVAGSTAGCNLMALPFFLLPGMEPKHDAKFKLASDDKEKEVRVLILATAGLEVRPEFLKIDREISQMLAVQLQEGFKKNKEKVSIIPTSRVEKYKDEHPNWQSVELDQIGKSFHADYVVNLEINSISLYEPGSSNTLYRGRAAVSVAVVDVHESTEGPKFRHEYTCEYPRARGPIPAGDSNSAQFRQAFLTLVAKELSWLFTSHPVDDDFTCD